MHLYEDLVTLGRSQKYIHAAVVQHDRVYSASNKRRGVAARRGDGAFGEIIPGESAAFDDGYRVGRGPLATVEIGVEVKILSKAMIKQIDRVINDLSKQLSAFRKGGGHPICVAIVGINHADRYTGYEGQRQFPTTGRGGFLHPIQEAAKAEKRLIELAKPGFDEFLILRFKATNELPFPFDWVDLKGTRLDYAASLARISAEYQRRF